MAEDTTASTSPVPDGAVGNLRSCLQQQDVHARTSGTAQFGAFAPSPVLECSVALLVDQRIKVRSSEILSKELTLIQKSFGCFST